MGAPFGKAEKERRFDALRKSRKEVLWKGEPALDRKKPKVHTRIHGKQKPPPPSVRMPNRIPRKAWYPDRDAIDLGFVLAPQIGVH